MDSSVSPKDEIWFLRLCHHISNAVYLLTSLTVWALSLNSTRSSLGPVKFIAKVQVLTHSKGLNNPLHHLVQKSPPLYVFLSQFNPPNTSILNFRLIVTCDWRLLPLTGLFYCSTETACFQLYARATRLSHQTATVTNYNAGRDSAPRIATRYRPDGQLIESQWRRNFPRPAKPASYTIGTGGFPGVKRPGRGVDHPPPSSAEVNGRVELYLFYSSSGSSCPVLGCTFELQCPALSNFSIPLFIPFSFFPRVSCPIKTGKVDGARERGASHYKSLIRGQNFRHFCSNVRQSVFHCCWVERGVALSVWPVDYRGSNSGRGKRFFCYP
jgi:hypothetical protein